MRLLSAQNMFHLPAHGGASKANRTLVTGLAARGWECTVIAPMSGGYGARTTEEYLAELERRGITEARVTDDAVIFDDGGVRVHAVRASARLGGYAVTEGRAFAPDLTLASSDDPGALTLGAALRVSPSRTVYLAHTLQQFPFGPRAFHPSRAATAMVRRCAAVAAFSDAVAAYIREHAGLRARVLPLPVYGDGPFPMLANPAEGAITMVNPCAYKGVSVFLGLADARPDLAFLAVPSWGTTEADRAALAARPNIEIIDPVDDIERLLSRTRILVMPSLWDESLGLTAVEAMLRGVPVLASDVGGLPEAKLGVPYLLPVRPITTYRTGITDRLLPEPVVPEQDIGPWLAALDALTGDADHYRRISEASFRAAGSHVAGLSLDPFDTFLRQVAAGETECLSPVEEAAPPVRDLPERRRAALAALLARRRAAPKTEPS